MQVVEYVKKHPYITAGGVVAVGVMVYIILRARGGGAAGGADASTALVGSQNATADQIALIGAQSQAQIAGIQAQGQVQTQEQVNAIQGQENLASLQVAAQQNQLNTQLAAANIAAQTQLTQSALAASTQVQLAQIQTNANVAVANIQAGIFGKEIQAQQQSQLIGGLFGGGGIKQIGSLVGDAVSWISGLF